MVVREKEGGVVHLLIFLFNVGFVLTEGKQGPNILMKNKVNQIFLQTQFGAIL